MKRYAEFQQVKLNGDDAIQYITDSMANKMNIQIEYQGSGWRTVLPYSFTTSQDNNLLVMCYKQDGSVRSYRFDRIEQLFVDDSLMNVDNNETGVMITDSSEEIHNNMSDFEIPYLPEYDDILELSENEEGEPFQEAIDTLEEGEYFEPQQYDEDGNPIEEDAEDFDVSSDNSEDLEETDDDMENEEVEEPAEEDDTDFDLDEEESTEEEPVDFDLDEEESI